MENIKISERLKAARERSGLKLNAVSVKAGIGTSSLSEFENGVREPSLSQLRKLADVYHLSLGFFVEGELQEEPVVLWHSRPEAPHANGIKSRFLELCEQYRNLEVWCRARANPRLPEVKEHLQSSLHAEALATRVHRELELGHRPGHSLQRVLEEFCGVKIIHFEFDHSCAACTVTADLGACVLLNSRAPRARRNFDLAHELFHLLTWPSFRATHIRSDDGTALAPEEEERLADVFARNLLIPRDVLIESLQPYLSGDKLTFDDLFNVARQFDVEVEELLRRVGDVCSLAPAQVATLVRRYTETARERHQVAITLEDRDPVPDRPMRFRALAMTALHGGEISQGQFATYMGMSRRDVIRIMDQKVKERADDEEVTIAPA